MNGFIIKTNETFRVGAAYDKIASDPDILRVVGILFDAIMSNDAQTVKALIKTKKVLKSSAVQELAQRMAALWSNTPMIKALFPDACEIPEVFSFAAIAKNTNALYGVRLSNYWHHLRDHLRESPQAFKTQAMVFAQDDQALIAQAHDGPLYELPWATLASHLQPPPTPRPSTLEEAVAIMKNHEEHTIPLMKNWLLTLSTQGRLPLLNALLTSDPNLFWGHFADVDVVRHYKKILPSNVLTILKGAMACPGCHASFQESARLKKMVSVLIGAWDDYVQEPLKREWLSVLDTWLTLVQPALVKDRGALGSFLHHLHRQPSDEQTIKVLASLMDHEQVSPLCKRIAPLWHAQLEQCWLSNNIATSEMAPSRKRKL